MNEMKLCVRVRETEVDEGMRPHVYYVSTKKGKQMHLFVKKCATFPLRESPCSPCYDAHRVNLYIIYI